MLSLSHIILLVAAVCRLDCAAFMPSQSISPFTFHSVGIPFATQHNSLYTTTTTTTTTTRLRMEDGDDDDDKEENDDELIMTRAEISASEEESSKKVFDRLALPGRIGEAVQSAAYLFVACGLLLNVFGYSYVIQDKHITIDTLEHRNFVRESTKSMKESANEMRRQ
jgi:hypothetical protein